MVRGGPTEAPLHGRVALVTGVGRRIAIGAAVARRLAADGAAVVVHSYTPHDAEQPWGADPGGPQAVVAAITAAGGRAVHVPYHVTWELERAQPDPAHLPHPRRLEPSRPPNPDPVPHPEKRLQRGHPPPQSTPFAFAKPTQHSGWTLAPPANSHPLPLFKTGRAGAGWGVEQCCFSLSL